ncbi:hypothetical protein [Streptomyces bacillaris]|uniref:hypothetical protein n=1 Tax=Streptomyces bacillaris TaxID=68179 RepID=UPI00345F18D2
MSGNNTAELTMTTIQQSIESAVQRARQCHGRGAARHYHVTITKVTDGHRIAVDGRRPMSRRDIEEADLYPHIFDEHEREATRDAEFFIHELLSQIRAEGLSVEGLGKHETTVGDLLAYDFALVTA